MKRKRRKSKYRVRAQEAKENGQMLMIKHLAIKTGEKIKRKRRKKACNIRAKKKESKRRKKAREERKPGRKKKNLQREESKVTHPSFAL